MLNNRREQSSTTIHYFSLGGRKRRVFPSDSIPELDDTAGPSKSSGSHAHYQPSSRKKGMHIREPAAYSSMKHQANPHNQNLHN